MLRTTTLATIAALATAPAFAECNWGSKTQDSAAGYSTPATTAYVQPASATSYTQYAPTQPAITYANTQADIVDTAVSAGSFNTLVAAVQAADLVETLKGPGPFTVFAPTDEAFAALPEGTVESLLLPENKDKLAAVLTYHVVSGKVMSSDLAGKTTSAETVQGGTVDIDATSGVTVNGANVVTADIETSNGVIHVIDTVLLPGS